MITRRWWSRSSWTGGAGSVISKRCYRCFAIFWNFDRSHCGMTKQIQTKTKTIIFFNSFTIERLQSDRCNRCCRSSYIFRRWTLSNVTSSSSWVIARTSSKSQGCKINPSYFTSPYIILHEFLQSLTNRSCFFDHQFIAFARFIKIEDSCSLKIWRDVLSSLTGSIFWQNYKTSTHARLTKEMWER